MSNIIPIRSASRADVDDTAVTEQIEQIPGQVDLDLVIKSQLSAPQVARRIAELEDCLWAVANELMRFDPESASAERAKVLLNNRLEMGESSRTNGAAGDSPGGAAGASILPFNSEGR
jgi:hypothetical protein